MTNGRIARKGAALAWRCALFIGLGCISSASRAEDTGVQYLVEPGDILSLSVVGAPELTAKLPIGIDGTASFPLIGQLPIAGQTLAEVRSTVQKLMPLKSVHRTTGDGSTLTLMISPGDIGLSIDEYRPVYVNGDVAKPGEQPFRPGLTIRRAVAVAGGYDILRFKLDNPFLQLSDLSSEYESLWISYAGQQAAIARLKAELVGEPSLDKSALIDTPVSKSLSSAILENEQNQLDTNNADFQKEKAYLKAATTHEDERAQVLGQQRAEETQGVLSDTADVQRYEDLYKKGEVTLPRLVDARRTVLLSSTRELQTAALLASVQREEGDLNRRLDRLADTRRMDVLRNLQDLTTQLAVTRSKLQAVSEKLRYTGMLKSQLVRGIESEPTVFVLHDGANRAGKIAADLDTLLQPGDIVEIALQAAFGPGEP